MKTDSVDPEITLRDLFALVALHSWLSDFRGYLDNHLEKKAEECYRIADVMMEARKK